MSLHFAGAKNVSARIQLPRIQALGSFTFQFLANFIAVLQFSGVIWRCLGIGEVAGEVCCGGAK